MADEQEPKTEPEEKPEGKEPEGKPEGGDGESIRDSHGQEGISKAKYERGRRECEAKVADLEAKPDAEDVLVDCAGGVEMSDAVPIESRTRAMPEWAR